MKNIQNSQSQVDFNIARIQTGAFSKSMVFLITSIKSCRTFLVYFTFSVPLDFCNLLTCSVLICMLLREFSSDSKCFKCFGNFRFLSFRILSHGVCSRPNSSCSRPKSSCSRRNSEIPNAKQIKKVRQDVHSKPSISDLNPGDIEIHLTLRVLNIFY